MVYDKNRDVDPGLHELSAVVVDAAYRVYAELGPGLLESAYEACLVHALIRKGLRVERQVSLPVIFDGARVDAGFRIDVMVEGKLIVEIKSVDLLMPVHTAQIITYLKLTGQSLGLLINFNVSNFQTAVKRVVLTAKKETQSK